MAYVGIPPRPVDSRGKSWVFKPPPGWPEPPADWQPPAGWQPDPRWPPPPAGWQFWGPGPGRKRPGFSFYVKAVAGALTFAATIAGAYFAFRSQPHSPTTAGWVSQANAACDRDIGAVQMSFFDALLPSSDQAAGQSASTNQQLASRLRDMITVEGSLSKLNGDLAALQMPEDGRAPAVRAVLRSGNALVDSMSAFSSLTQSGMESNSAMSAAQIASLVKDGDMVLARSFTWQKAIRVLGLTRCPFWTANPGRAAQTMTPPTVTPSPGPGSSLTGGEQQLVDQLNPNDLTNCVGRPDQETGGVVAAVNCQSVQFGPIKHPLVVQFSDVGSAQTWFDDNTSGFVNNNDCADGYELGTWDHDGFLAGPWGCAYIDGGDFRMIWVADAPLIGIIADGTDGSAMYSWWTNWGYVLSRAG
jgi:hypothetical protein